MRLALEITAAAQVRVTVPATKFAANEKICARVDNNEREPVTFCVEIGHTSTQSATTEATPIPFVVQTMSKGSWHTLLIGPDIGSFHKAEVLDVGKSFVFPVRIKATGNMKPLLTYWVGSLPELNCSKPPKGSRRVESKPFVMKLPIEH
jgi:hypothetical protein